MTALRPTYGLVSRHGAMALSWTLDKLGPFAHTAEDCGLILQVIAGKDGKDPGSSGKGFYYTPQYARPMKDLKVGYARVDFAERAMKDETARVFVHCAAGVHRAAMMTLAILCADGWELQDAMRTIVSRRPVVDFADVYVESVERFLGEKVPE